MARLQSCQYMKRFPPAPCRLTSVWMTKALYAQLVSQQFYPPKIFEKNGYTVPAAAAASDSSADVSAKQSKRVELGVKIACGFEILYSESAANRRKGRAARARSDRIDEFADDRHHYAQEKGYLRYLVSLTKAGYFQGEIAGSSLYSQLEARAVAYWEGMQQGDDSRQGPIVADSIDRCLQDNSSQNWAVEGELREDDDAWLYIDEARLESMLKQQRQPARMDEAEADMQSDRDEDDDEKLAEREAKRLQAMAAKFETFVEGQGSLEGATLDDEMSEDDMGDEEDDGLQDDLVAGASTKLSEKEKQARLGKLVPGLDAEEWGAAAAEKLKVAARQAEDAKPESAASQLATAASAAKSDAADGSYTVTKSSLTAARLSDPDKLDGVSDSSDSEDERPAKQDPFMGAGGPSYNREALLELGNDEDDGPLVVDGDEDFQLDESEMEDFLKFTREALGLTEEQYSNIVESRKKRGAFVPEAGSGAKGLPGPQKRTVSGESKAAAQPRPFTEPSQTASSSGRNSNLDSFEALMIAMDTELQKNRSSASVPAPASRQTRKPTRKSAEGVVIEDVDSEDEDEDDDDMAGLDAELAAALKRGEDEDLNDGDYGLIKNFLESFKSQNGMAGPVSNMFGRLDSDFQMPRDG